MKAYRQNQAAKLLGISRQKMLYWVLTRKVKTFRFAGYPHIAEKEVERLAGMRDREGAIKFERMKYGRLKRVCPKLYKPKRKDQGNS